LPNFQRDECNTSAQRRAAVSDEVLDGPSGTEGDSPETVGYSTEDQAAEPSLSFCSTPTPRREAFQDQEFIFCQPQTVQWMQAPLPVFLPTLWPAAVPWGSLPAAGQALGTAENPRRQEGQAEAAEEASRALVARPPRENRLYRRRLWSKRDSKEYDVLRSSEVDGFVRTQWRVDERKLRGSDKRLLSSSFDVNFGFGSSPMAFVVMLYPRSATFRGSASFQQARGVGQVHLKCVSELGDDVPATIRVSIGGDQDRLLRGPFTHNFSASPLFTLPREQAEWDFGAAVEEGSASVTVSVDVALM
jgi:hypothetical protein